MAGPRALARARMLKTAEAAWEGQGFKVRGAALAGKAADGLQKDAGMREPHHRLARMGLGAGQGTAWPARRAGDR